MFLTNILSVSANSIDESIVIIKNIYLEEAEIEEVKTLLSDTMDSTFDSDEGSTFYEIYAYDDGNSTNNSGISTYGIGDSYLVVGGELTDKKCKLLFLNISSKHVLNNVEADVKLKSRTGVILYGKTRTLGSLGYNIPAYESYTSVASAPVDSVTYSIDFTPSGLSRMNVSNKVFR